MEVWERERVQDRKARKVRRVMGWELRRQVRVPARGWFGCPASIIAVLCVGNRWDQ